MGLTNLKSVGQVSCLEDSLLGADDCNLEIEFLLPQRSLSFVLQPFNWLYEAHPDCAVFFFQEIWNWLDGELKKLIFELKYYYDFIKWDKYIVIKAVFKEVVKINHVIFVKQNKKNEDSHVGL